MKKIGAVKSFFLSMLSGSPTVSSKRVIGMCSFLLVAIFAVRVVFAKQAIPNDDLVKDVFNTLFMIIAATILGGTIENVITANKKSDNEPAPAADAGEMPAPSKREPTITEEP